MRWTPNLSRNAEIVRRRKAGEWPRAIAREMGLSHNVVIGVCNRAGLSGPSGSAEVLHGSAVPNAKLTEAAVRNARQSYIPGRNRWFRGNLAELAAALEVTPETLRHAISGVSWKHVA